MRRLSGQDALFVYDELLYYVMTHDEHRNTAYRVAVDAIVMAKQCQQRRNVAQPAMNVPIPMGRVPQLFHANADIWLARRLETGRAFKRPHGDFGFIPYRFTLFVWKMSHHLVESAK